MQKLNGQQQSNVKPVIPVQHIYKYKPLLRCLRWTVGVHLSLGLQGIIEMFAQPISKCFRVCVR